MKQRNWVVSALVASPGTRSLLLSSAWAALVASMATIHGCSGGSSLPGVGIQNSSQAAPRLEEMNSDNEYSPYYPTGDLQRPRYFHDFIITRKGSPLVYGGSDERGYSGIDTLEIFDQSTFEKDAPRPPSLAGLWIDTNFEGDPMTFENGARMHSTANNLADGRVLIVGGGSDLLRSGLYEQAEVFDPETRTFETLESKMVLARFRHVSVPQNDGTILFIGGQIQTTVTIINENIELGQPGRERQETRFLTTNLSESFNPRENSFVRLDFPDSTLPSKLNTPRGRAGHAVTRLAGPDAALNTADDVLLVAGGFQGLSGQFAPENKFPYTIARRQGDGLTVFEFYDAVTRVFTQVSNLSLDLPRLNTPYLMNLGTHNDFTPDGVKGMGNVVLVTGGNDDQFCPETHAIDTVLVANYSGFGPAQGLQFFRIVDDTFFSHVQGTEYLPTPPFIDPHFLGVNAVGRAATNPIAMPRGLVTASNVSDIETWIISIAGVDIFPTPNGCAFNYGSPTMLAGCVFDPFFNRASTQLALSPRDLASQRSSNNRLGVIGCWLHLDGAIPTVDLSNFGSTAPTRWAKRFGIFRAWPAIMAVAGEDGIIESVDDRVLLAGGGTEYGDPVSVGSEPTTPSCEILILPGSNSKQPSP
ncbi:MAG TPA: hypothetical protein VMT52_11585 [Planctomycetota bacterium]|nr:hypothetical protein [Planctomycetota bacterium]